jgi:hypothetical protein
MELLDFGWWFLVLSIVLGQLNGPVPAISVVNSHRSSDKAIRELTWSRPRGVAGYIEALGVGEAVMPISPLGCLNPCKSS